LQENLAVLALTCLRLAAGTGTRRLMVKSCVQMLHEARANGLREMKSTDMERLIGGVREELTNKVQDEVATEGE